MQADPVTPADASPSGRPRWILAAGMALVAAAALLPWLRNRGYVRHFFDYGLVIAGVTRIEEGERPYRDFSTPNQSGAFVFNLAAEKLGGGTYQAMTLGAGIFIALSVCLLAGMLCRRWLPLASLAVAAAVVCAGVSQHTIIWYNSVGVVCLALAAWGAARAPVLRREDAGWHAVVAAALLVGGVTKLNFQLVALAVTGGWALRAGWTRRAAWTRVGVTLVFVGIFGAVLPVAGELAWTGATPALWWHNAVSMATPERAENLAAALRPDFYLRPVHDHYGPLRLPQTGLLGVLLTAAAVMAAWRRRAEEKDRCDRRLLIAAGLLALGGGAGLLATNYEIDYVGMAAWLALAAGLWLGFEVPSRGAAFYGGLVLPALLVAAISWESAWRGQRSQFGYSSAPRGAYRDGGAVDPDFAYLRGTFLPPEECESLADLARWHRIQPPVGGVLYGPGLEWLERAWPVAKVPRLPLAIRWGATCGPRESAALAAALRPGGELPTVLVSLPEDLWRGESLAVLARSFTRTQLAPQIVLYERGHPKPIPGEPGEVLGKIGGNVDPRLLSAWMAPQADGRGGDFLGVTRGDGALAVTAPCRRATNEAVLRRRGTAEGPAIAIRFWVNAQRADGAERTIWEKFVDLPAGEPGLVVPCGELDAAGLSLVFRVSVPATAAGRVAAGWRGPTITHAVDGPAEPPRLRKATLPEVPVDPAMLAALFPTGWRPDQVVVRGGRLTDAGCELPPGGEIWTRVPGVLTEYSGLAGETSGRSGAPTPAVRVVWYKGGRLQFESQGVLRESDHRMEFRAWSAEPDGWFGILADADPATAAPVVVRVTRVVPGQL
ncbi:MAG TPA: hypothetical protein VLT83_00425 [Opitutaceae bacterium]|nr:hypothetical protein [Opitutaceae bacterium]